MGKKRNQKKKIKIRDPYLAALVATQGGFTYLSHRKGSLLYLAVAGEEGKVNNKIVYYAHSMKIYGTKREAKEVEFLRKKFRQVVNPSVDIPSSRGMGNYLKAVEECDVLVCSEYKKHIGKGVFEEIRCAFEGGKILMCIKKTLGRYRLKKIKGAVVADSSDWFIKYGKVCFGKYSEVKK